MVNVAMKFPCTFRTSKQIEYRGRSAATKTQDAYFYQPKAIAFKRSKTCSKPVLPCMFPTWESFRHPPKTKHNHPFIPASSIGKAVGQCGGGNHRGLNGKKQATAIWPCISILLMVQKSGVHQLRLVVYPIIYRVLYINRIFAVVALVVFFGEMFFFCCLITQNKHEQNL